jgi:hypothetical protein
MPGQSLVNTCFSNQSLQSINEFEWIDVRSDQGELLLADTARYVEFTALVVGHSYAVEVPATSDRWTDGTTSDQHADTAISNDNGATWEPLNADTSIIDCAEHDTLENSYKAKFTMADGQIWKIRVNDTDGAFADNGGALGFKFYVLCDGMACTGSLPNDSVGSGSIPAVSIQGGGDVCQIAVVRHLYFRLYVQPWQHHFGMGAIFKFIHFALYGMVSKTNERVSQRSQWVQNQRAARYSL